ncbi:hypothetical protein D3C86_1567380 [compost metagenome]
MRFSLFSSKALLSSISFSISFTRWCSKLGNFRIEVLSDTFLKLKPVNSFNLFSCCSKATLGLDISFANATSISLKNRIFLSKNLYFPYFLDLSPNKYSNF